jgi:hypothetical protein
LPVGKNKMSLGKTRFPVITLLLSCTRINKNTTIKPLNMKITAIIIVLSMLLATITSCQKDKTDDVPFNATGYWHGNAYIINCFIVNNANGTARLYYQVPAYDTASATEKMNGTYTLSNGLYYGKFGKSIDPADSIYFETTSVSGNTMNGKLITGFGASFDAHFAKQP